MIELPAILNALGDSEPEVRDAALEALEEIYVHCEDGACTTDPAIADAALPAALRALGDSDPGVRITAARAVRLLAADAATAVSPLTAALADPSRDVRLEVLGALGELGAAAAAAAHAVGQRLADAFGTDERSAAAYTLGNLGAPDDQIDLLIAALLTDEPPVQAAAAYALSAALDRGSEHASATLRRLALRKEDNGA